MKDNTKKISVIMPVYNTKEEYLREAIESILNQTYTDFELIIINDGSTNNSEDVIKSYTDERIRYIKQDNQGAAGSRNNGIKAAIGEYIAIMDSDDISYPNRLEEEVKFLDGHPDYAIVGSSAEIFPRTKMWINVEEPRILDFIRECNFVHSTVMYRRKLFIENGYTYDLMMPPTEDYDLWSKIILKEKAYNIQKPLVRYRLEGQGISSTNKNKGELNTIKVQKRLLDFITKDKKLQTDIIDLIYRKNKIKKRFYEQIFSIKNFRKFDKKYKVITVLGVEIQILIKRYKYD